MLLARGYTKVPELTGKFAPTLFASSRLFTAGACTTNDTLEYPYPHILGSDGPLDTEYPGTSTLRLLEVLKRVRQLDSSKDLSGNWSENVRKLLLWAGGLKDIQNLTGHAFNDDSHCDLATMVGAGQGESNRNCATPGISRRNQPVTNIQRGSEVFADVSGGSWSTCINGANATPRPKDVAHKQFRSRVAFKLVWTPISDFERFVLVDDNGGVLKESGAIDFSGPGPAPSLRARKGNYELVKGGIYDVERQSKLRCTSI